LHGEDDDAESKEVNVETRCKLDILVNGEALATSAATLHELVAERGLADARVATARNGDFVPARARATTALEPGDRIEIVSPRHGG
jgi:sulfur carrier protein